MIYFNGKCSDDYNLIVESFPVRPIPRRRVVSQSIPGRNKALLLTEPAFENVIQRYDVYISAEERASLQTAARAVSEWLSQPGYCRLEDSYDPDVFRLAYFTGGQELENTLNMFGRASIEFSCAPQRFLKDGERALTVSGSGLLVNPTQMTALPLIRARGTGSFIVGDITVEITDQPTAGYIDLDSDIEDAFAGNVNCNGFVRLLDGDFPVLPAGETEIEADPGLTLEIIPRWWSL